MKKSIFFCIFLILAVLGGLIFSGCELTEASEGTINGNTISEGTIRLMNNSTNVIIVYWAIERGGGIIEESHININPGASSTTIINTGFYIIYLEDQHGDGWETRSSVNVRRDQTVDVKFPSDFRVAY